MPKPGEFSLGSMESRAAARAMVAKLAEQEKPREGFDVLVQLEETGWPDRHLKILHALDGRGRLTSRPKRIAGLPFVWLALPVGANLGQLFVNTANNAPKKQPADPDGSVMAFPVLLSDLPYLWECLTDREQNRLLGKGEGASAPRR
jgi:hypothetical protein